jgi:hypothetical protein
VEIILGDVDVVSPGVFEKDNIGIVLHVTNDGIRDEEDEKAADEENDDADVKNAARVPEGRGLVGRFGFVEKVIFIRTVLVVI